MLSTRKEFFSALPWCLLLGLKVIGNLEEDTEGLDTTRLPKALRHGSYVELKKQKQQNFRRAGIRGETRQIKLNKGKFKILP